MKFLLTLLKNDINAHSFQMGFSNGLIKILYKIIYQKINTSKINVKIVNLRKF